MRRNELYNNLNYIPETNWSIASTDSDIWTGDLPYKEGMKFPTDDIIKRAEISNTNLLIYENKVEEIYNDIISIFPEIDPMYGWQIREIITALPFFKNATNSWVGLIASDLPLFSVDDDDDDLDIKMSNIVENSNILNIFQEEVKSRFLDVISAYRVDVDLNGKPNIIKIDTKNLIVFVNKEHINCIEVVVVFSIYTEQDNEYIDFISYYYDGRIIKDTFEYSNESIGAHISREEDRAFGGLFNESPVVVFKHNVNGNNIYGTDQYRYWIPSMLSGMRELQNVLRLGERTREMIRKVPESAIKKSSADGSSVFLNRGTLPYSDTGDVDGNKIPVEYVVPEIRMDEAIKALNIAINQIGMDTQLGAAFYNLSNLGSKLSSESIKAALFPCRLEAKRITSEMKNSLKELVIKLCYLNNISLKNSKMSITFYDGFPKDEYRDIEAIQKRLESSKPSITLEDAIMKFDRVPLRIAKIKAEEIRGHSLENVDDVLFTDDVVSDDINSNNTINIDMETLGPSAGDNKIKNEPYIRKDDAIWETQMYPKPRDIPQGYRGEVRKFWVLRKLRTKIK